MLRTVPALVLVSLVLASGCATAGSEAPSALPSAALTSGPCLPPGLSGAFFSWPVVGFRSVDVPLVDGKTISASWVLYRQGDSLVVALWSEKDLLAVDPSPQTDTPFWIDTALVVADGKSVRTDRGAACRWRRQGEQHAAATSRG